MASVHDRVANFRQFFPRIGQNVLELASVCAFVLSSRLGEVKR